MDYIIAGLVGIALVMLWEISAACKRCATHLWSIDRELTEFRREAEYRALDES